MTKTNEITEGLRAEKAERILDSTRRELLRLQERYERLWNEKDALECKLAALSEVKESIPAQDAADGKDSLRAENARLREALEKIKRWSLIDSNTRSPYEIALAALAPASEAGKHLNRAEKAERERELTYWPELQAERAAHAEAKAKLETQVALRESAEREIATLNPRLEAGQKENAEGDALIARLEADLEAALATDIVSLRGQLEAERKAKEEVLTDLKHARACWTTAEEDATAWEDKHIALAKRLEAAVLEVAETGALLGVLRMGLPYKEFSPEFTARIIERTDAVRAFLTAHAAHDRQAGG